MPSMSDGLIWAFLLAETNLSCHEINWLRRSQFHNVHFEQGLIFFLFKIFHSFFRVIFICNTELFRAQVLGCLGERHSRWGIWPHRIRSLIPDQRASGKCINFRGLLLPSPSLRSTGRLPIRAETCRRLFLEQGCLEVTFKA